MSTCPCGYEAEELYYTEIMKNLPKPAIACFEACGAHTDGHTWVKECRTCGARVEELTGLFVPHLCKSCEAAQVEEEIRHGHICSLCG